MKKQLISAAVSAVLVFSAPAFSTGIPVVDVTAIAKTVQEGLLRAQEAKAALDQAMLNQILIQTNLQDSAPFHVRMACARCSASRPVLCLICGTVAWGRRTSSTPRWI